MSKFVVFSVKETLSRKEVIFINRVDLIGWLSANPVLNKKNGNSYYSFVLAVKKFNGSAIFFRCVSTSRTEKPISLLRKSDFIRISGYLNIYRKYKNEIVTVLVQEVEFFPKLESEVSLFEEFKTVEGSDLFEEEFCNEEVIK